MKAKKMELAKLSSLLGHAVIMMECVQKGVREEDVWSREQIDAGLEGIKYMMDTVKIELDKYTY